MKLNLSRDMKMVRVSNAVASGTTTITSAVVDMRGFRSVCFVAALGDVADTSALNLRVKTNSANSTSSPTPVQTTAAAAFTAGAATADNKMIMVDVHEPRQRYVFVELVRATAAAAVDGIFAILYNGAEGPQEIADNTDFVSSSFNNDPGAA
jgi:hypothetical protein